MKAGVTRRPYETNLTMSVHSLLLGDALQTFGPDYELLVASHKHVTVDSVSGSLRGSDPASPASPGSPGLLSSPPPSQFDISKASLDPSKHVRYGWAGGYSVWVKRYSKALNDAKKDNDFS